MKDVASITTRLVKVGRIVLRLLVATAITTALLLPSSCARRVEKRAHTVIFVLFDLSGSTTDPQIRQRYYDGFTKILDSLKGGELLLGDIVTDNTLATASFPLNALFPEYSALTINRMVFDEEMKKVKEELLKRARKLLFETEPAPATDILSGFRLADKVFNAEEGRLAEKKALVVFSDMVEQSKLYDFTRIKLDQKKIEKIIESERASKVRGLPDLHGVKVWVVGATVARKGGLSPQKIREIENFWVAYFKATGAYLTPDRYLQTLVNFRL